MTSYSVVDVCQHCRENCCLFLPKRWKWWADIWRIWVQFLVRVKVFFLCHCIQIGTGVFPASCLVGTRGSFPKDKAGVVWHCQLTFIQFWKWRNSGVVPPQQS